MNLRNPQDGIVHLPKVLLLLDDLRLCLDGCVGSSVSTTSNREHHASDSAGGDWPQVLPETRNRRAFPSPCRRRADWGTSNSPQQRVLGRQPVTIDLLLVAARYCSDPSLDDLPTASLHRGSGRLIEMMSNSAFTFEFWCGFRVAIWAVRSCATRSLPLADDCNAECERLRNPGEMYRGREGCWVSRGRYVLRRTRFW